MQGVERTADLNRRLQQMGALDRWADLHLEQFENLTGISAEELAGSAPAVPAQHDWHSRDFRGRFFPEEQEEALA
jgi:hypothetical protein